MRDLASQGNLKSLSSLSETCWSLYHAGNPILYEWNIEHQECSGFKWAVSNDQVNTLKKFLQYGVPINYSLRYHEAQRDELVAPLWLAARHGSIEVVRHFFTLPDVDWNWASEDFNDTPLHVAIESGHTDLALLLLSRPEVLVNAEDGGNEALVKHLLSINSVDPDHRTRTGKSALFIAADWGRSTDIVKLLLDTGRVDVNFVSLKTHDTPLTAAKRPDVVKLLVEHPDIDVNFTPTGNAAPITIAAEEGRLEIVKILLTHPDIDPDGSEYPSEAPILRAAEEGHEEVVSVLLADDRVGQESRRLLAKKYPQFL
ncbi:ankyrin repeat-containing domain protein [Trichoderma camerunense]